jgi:hypothetical protein
MINENLKKIEQRPKAILLRASKKNMIFIMVPDSYSPTVALTVPPKHAENSMVWHIISSKERTFKK